MDKIETYRHYIEQVFEKYKSYNSSNNSVKTELLIDKERDHYQLGHIGWKNDDHILGCVVRIDIINEKIYIQYDGLENLVDDFTALGVPNHDIVLAFHPPKYRKYTDYAIE